jgi:hypothetical protein
MKADKEITSERIHAALLIGENQRKADEIFRKNDEIIRQQNEQLRDTNISIAIRNAENATQEALDAAEEARQTAQSSLPDIGNQGTYNKVTTDSKGRVQNGSLETTISGLGVTDVYNKDEIDNIIIDLDHNKLNKNGDSSNTNVTINEATLDEEIITGSLGVILGLIKKKFSVMLTSLAGKIDRTAIANNSITTQTGLVLDACQGKVLQDQITEQNNNLGKYNLEYHARIYPTSGCISGIVTDKIAQGYKGGDIQLIGYAPPDSYIGEPYGVIKWVLVFNDIAHLQFIRARENITVTRAISASEKFDTGWVVH